MTHPAPPRTDGAARDYLYGLGRLLLCSVDSTDVLQGIAEGLCFFTGCSRSVIVDFDQDSGRMQGIAGHGVPAEAVGQIHTYVHETPLVQAALHEGTPMVVHDPSAANSVPDRYLQMFAVEGSLGVAPLDSDALGLLGLAFVDRGGVRFELTDAEDRAFREFCSIASLAMQNAILVERSQQLAAMLERSRIAAELHDGVTQLLFSAGMVLDEVLDDPALPSGVVDHLRAVRGEIADGGRQLRGALFELTRPAETVTDTLGAIRKVVDDFVRRTGLLADVQVVGRGTDLVGAQRALMVRAVAEALRNVEKYADATEVVVRVRRGHEWWMVDVDDDGEGDPRAVRRHLNLAAEQFGLYSLSREADHLGGRLWIARPPRLRGICVSLSLPVNNAGATA